MRKKNYHGNCSDRRKGPTTSIWGGGSNRVLSECRTQIVCHTAREKNNNNELLQNLFFYGRRVVPGERLLCYHTQNVSRVDGYLFRSVTQLVKQMCCLLHE